MRVRKVEFAGISLLARSSIVTDHCLFVCLKAIFFGYSHAVGAGGQAWLSKNFHVLGVLSHR